MSYILLVPTRGIGTEVIITALTICQESFDFMSMGQHGSFILWVFALMAGVTLVQDRSNLGRYITRTDDCLRPSIYEAADGTVSLQAVPQINFNWFIARPDIVVIDTEGGLKAFKETSDSGGASATASTRASASASYTASPRSPTSGNISDEGIDSCIFTNINELVVDVPIIPQRVANKMTSAVHASLAALVPGYEPRKSCYRNMLRLELSVHGLWNAGKIMFLPAHSQYFDVPRALERSELHRSGLQPRWYLDDSGQLSPKYTHIWEDKDTIGNSHQLLLVLQYSPTPAGRTKKRIFAEDYSSSVIPVGLSHQMPLFKALSYVYLGELFRRFSNPDGMFNANLWAPTEKREQLGLAGRLEEWLFQHPERRDSSRAEG